jgi:hypothetical protein
MAAPLRSASSISIVEILEDSVKFNMSNFINHPY